MWGSDSWVCFLNYDGIKSELAKWWNSKSNWVVVSTADTFSNAINCVQVTMSWMIPVKCHSYETSFDDNTDGTTGYTNRHCDMWLLTCWYDHWSLTKALQGELMTVLTEICDNALLTNRLQRCHNWGHMSHDRWHTGRWHTVDDVHTLTTCIVTCGCWPVDKTIGDWPRPCKVSWWQC